MAARNMEDIAELFRGLRFQKRIFGGVDERDVWSKLKKVQAEYRNAYEAQKEGLSEPPGKKKRTEMPEQVIGKRLRDLVNRADIIAFAVKAILLAVFLYIAFGLVFGVMPVPDEDMNPVLSAGDLVLYYRLEDTFASGDIVVYEADGEKYIGRVAARGGDSVEITEDAQLRVNGSTVIEADIYYSTPQYESEVTYPLTLGEDEYFILADYREGGRDSRYFGAVEADDIGGVLLAALRRAGM